jgi:hypothetical protein
MRIYVEYRIMYHTGFFSAVFGAYRSIAKGWSYRRVGCFLFLESSSKDPAMTTIDAESVNNL